MLFGHGEVPQEGMTADQQQYLEQAQAAESLGLSLSQYCRTARPSAYALLQHPAPTLLRKESCAAAHSTAAGGREALIASGGVYPLWSCLITHKCKPSRSVLGTIVAALNTVSAIC